MTRASALLVLVLGACALTRNAAPLDIHYYTPEAERPAAQARAPSSEARLRIGRIEASDHLRSRIARRGPSHEVALSDTRRWTEHPDVYVRRALVRSLFEHRDLVQLVGGAGPVLDVEVTAFEQVDTPRGPVGRVELRYQLADDRVVVARGRVVVERPISAGGSFEAVVSAIGAALDAATEAVAARLSLHLAPPDRQPVGSI